MQAEMHMPAVAMHSLTGSGVWEDGSDLGFLAGGPGLGFLEAWSDLGFLGAGSDFKFFGVGSDFEFFGAGSDFEVFGAGSDLGFLGARLDLVFLISISTFCVIFGIKLCNLLEWLDFKLIGICVMKQLKFLRRKFSFKFKVQW